MPREQVGGVIIGRAPTRWLPPLSKTPLMLRCDAMLIVRLVTTICEKACFCAASWKVRVITRQTRAVRHEHAYFTRRGRYALERAVRHSHERRIIMRSLNIITETTTTCCSPYAFDIDYRHHTTVHRFVHLVTISPSGLGHRHASRPVTSFTSTA